MIWPLAVVGWVAIELILRKIGQLRRAGQYSNVTLQRHLPTLLILAQVMPMLGLLGTVVGMAHVFGALGGLHTLDPEMLAAGISEALISTEVSLVLAIPTMFAYSILAGRIDRVIVQNRDPILAAETALVRGIRAVGRGISATLILLFLFIFATFLSHHVGYQLPIPKMEIVTVTDLPRLESPQPVTKPKPPEPVTESKAPAETSQPVPKLTPVVPTKNTPPPPTEISGGTPIVDLATADALPQVLEKIRPKYPPVAREAGVECVMLLAMVITETGTVDSAEVLQVSTPGFGFESSALKAAYGMTFKPITQNGVPIKVKVYYPIRFVLKE